jgi:hypothetical protein
MTRLNWGAFLFTPFWLMRNGLWITLMFFLLIEFFFPLASLLFSVYFLFYGNGWSWGNGTRWQSIDTFADSQYRWNFLALICLSCALGVAALHPGSVGSLVVLFHR